MAEYIFTSKGSVLKVQTGLWNYSFPISIIGYSIKDSIYLNLGGNIKLEITQSDSIYFNGVLITYDDFITIIDTKLNPTQEISNFPLDSFGRIRTSEITTLIDLKQLHDKQPLFIDEVLNGTATSTHSSTLAQTSMQTSASGDYVIRQTYQRFGYISGKSQQILITTNNFQAETNIIKRQGYYTSDTTGDYNTNLDGIILEQDNGVSVKIYRTGTLIHEINQEDFDDPLNGKGSSGINIDWSLNQIVEIKFEWLGVGAIICSLVYDGQFYEFHRVNNANRNTNVYMSSPNKPLRWEIRQTGVGSGTFNHICASVGFEGSRNKIGKSFGVVYPNLQFTAAGTSYAAIGIKNKSTHLDALLDVIKFGVMPTTNDDFIYELKLNPTITGTFTYNDVSNSCAQIAYTTTSPAATVTGGTTLIAGSGKSTSTIDSELQSALKAGVSIDGTIDEVVLCITPLSVGLDATCFLNWDENI